MTEQPEWIGIIRKPSPTGLDPTYDAFIAAWHSLTDDQRSRFVDESVDDLLMFDARCRLQPGPGFADE